jgi:hypothetical protein
MLGIQPPAFLLMFPPKLERNEGDTSRDSGIVMRKRINSSFDIVSESRMRTWTR